MRWWDRAACLGKPGEIFYPTTLKSRAGKTPPTDYTEARAICAGCPVRQECLDDAIETETAGRHGMFGGMSPAERTAEARRRKAEGTLERRSTRAARCGTESGYNRHVTHLKEPACVACLHAKAAGKAANLGRDAYTSRAPEGYRLYGLETIASRRDLYDVDDEAI